MLAAFMASEYSKPGTLAAFLPTMPAIDGPILFWPACTGVAGRALASEQRIALLGAHRRGERGGCGDDHRKSKQDPHRMTSCRTIGN